MVVESSGTQTAVVGTEHTLAAPTTAKTRVLWVALDALASGDTVELRVYSTVLSGGTSGVAKSVSFTGAQSEPKTPSVPYPMAFGGSFTLKQTAGTARSFPWRVDVLD